MNRITQFQFNIPTKNSWQATRRENPPKRPPTINIVDIQSGKITDKEDEYLCMCS